MNDRTIHGGQTYITFTSLPPTTLPLGLFESSIELSSSTSSSSQSINHEIIRELFH